MRTLAKLLCLAVALPTLAWAEPSASPSPQSDKLRDALTEMVETVTQAATESKGFILDQAPDVFKQYLAWEAFVAQAWMWAWVVVGVICLALAVWSFVDNEEGCGFFFSCATLVIFMLAFSCWTTLKKIDLAPKVYLVEYAKSLVK